MSANQPLSFNPAWMRAVEQLVVPALENKVRVLGLTAPHIGAGVSSLASAAAESIARSGTRVLCVDFSQPVANVGGEWAPGDGTAPSRIEADPAGFDRLTAVASAESRYTFNNGKRLRRTLFDELSEYTVIVVDLPALIETETDSINPLAVALACDQVLMVCARDRTTRPQITDAAHRARQAGVKLGGIVWNDFSTPSLGMDIAGSVRRRLGFFPPLAHFLERRFARSTFLNS